MTDLEIIQPLTDEELSTFVDLEAIIRNGRRIFLQVGKALRQIRDRRLYRADYPTFEAYCNERWGFKRQRASQQIKAAETAELVEPVGVTILNESVARTIRTESARIAGSDPVKQTEVAQEIALKAAAIAAVANTPMTSTHVKQAVEPVKQSEDDKIRQQVYGSNFAFVIQRMNAGMSPKDALLLVDTLKACEPVVRGDMIRLGITDTSVIRKLNEIRKSETYGEIVKSGVLQGADWFTNAHEATIGDLQALLTERHIEHRRRAAAERDAALGVEEVVLTLRVNDLTYSAEMLEAMYGYENTLKLAQAIIERAKQRETKKDKEYVQ